MRVSFNADIGAAPAEVGISAETAALLEQVRDTVSFRQVFDHYGLLWKGDGTHQLSCAFHARFRDSQGRPVEKNPSARFYAAERMIWCFACNEGGDVVWFVRKADQLGSLRDAIKRTGEIAGVNFEQPPAIGELERTQRRLAVRPDEGVFKYAVIDLARNTINDQLWKLHLLDRTFAPAVDRLTLAVMSPLVEIEAVYESITYGLLGERVRTWHRWALDIIETTWRHHHDHARTG